MTRMKRARLTNVVWFGELCKTIAANGLVRVSDMLRNL